MEYDTNENWESGADLSQPSFSAGLFQNSIIHPISSMM